MRFDVYGRFKLEVVREGNQWAVYRLEIGKRIKVREFAIPSSLREAEIGTFLDDIYHELAKRDRRCNAKIKTPNNMAHLCSPRRLNRGV